MIPKPAKRPRKPRTRLWKRRRGSKAALAREADKLWSSIVRTRGECEKPMTYRCPGPWCSGVIQAAHGLSRRYRNTRWLLINGFALCQAHHVYYTHRPIEWDEWLRWAWGQATYDELRKLALSPTPPNVEMALERLKAEAKSRGIA